MLTRMPAIIAALTLIGLAAAALPALAQSGGDSSGAGAAAPTATADATPTATPSPGPTSFSVSPHIGRASARGLARLGDKWYVSSGVTGGVYIFKDDGTYVRSVNSHRFSHGLAAVGEHLISIGTANPSISKWKPSPGQTVYDPANTPLPSIPGSGNLRGEGIAYDGENTWVVVAGPRSGPKRFSEYSLIKMDAAGTSTIYRMNAWVTALTYEDNHLYGLTMGQSPDLVRVRIKPSSDLQAYTATNPPMNNWEVEQRDVGVYKGLVFRYGVAYGFNNPKDATRQVLRARQPSPERLFALTPSIGDQLPHGITRVRDKWHVAGHSGDGYVHIFSNTGTYERRIKAPDATIRGLASDGTSLFAAANSTANAISVADDSSVAVYVPHIYKWTPQADETAPASATTFCIPNALGYTPNGVAYDADGTHIWAALDSPSRNILVKLNATIGAHLGTYQMNNAVSGLTYKNGNLYALSDGNIVMAVASHLKTSPATWVNNWEVVKRDSGLSNGLVFRDRTAHGFNAAQDEVRAESGSPTIAAAPASPAGVTSPPGSVPPTGSDPSDAAAPAPNPATPSSGADANPSG